MADGLHEVALSRTGWPQEQHVAVLPDELAGGQIEDLLALDGGVEAEVEVFERARVVEGGGFDPPGQEPLVPDVEFVLDDQLQELLVAQPIGRGLLDPDFPRLGQPREPKLT